MAKFLRILLFFMVFYASANRLARSTSMFAIYRSSTVSIPRTYFNCVFCLVEFDQTEFKSEQ